jgi:hypothetical protein
LGHQLLSCTWISSACHDIALLLPLLLLLLLLQGGLREVLARQRVALEGARLLVLNAAEALDRYVLEKGMVYRLVCGCILSAAK